jgi:hypothetical protein
VIDISKNITYTPIPGRIGSIVITPSSYTVGEACRYTLQYLLLRNIQEGSTISVTLPKQISISSPVLYSYSINDSLPINPIVSNSTSNGLVTLTFLSIFQS